MSIGFPCAGLMSEAANPPSGGMLMHHRGGQNPTSRLSLAETLPFEMYVWNSAQVYRGMDIGTRQTHGRGEPACGAPLSTFAIHGPKTTPAGDFTRDAASGDAGRFGGAGGNRCWWAARCCTSTPGHGIAELPGRTRR